MSIYGVAYNSKELNTNFLLHKYLAIAGILLLALYFRVHRLGDDPFFQDQAATSMGALHVLQGKWPLEGPMEFALIRDPPLPSYLYAIPFSVSGDPRIARIFTALWNLSAVSLAYKISSRYFGTRAGLIAIALYATHPTAVVASRFIWNPNLASPLVMLYVYTGLLGYFEFRQIGRLLHLPFMALASLCHPSLALLAPVSLLLWLWAWWQHATERRKLIIQGVVSLAIAILLLAPWILASIQLNYGLSSNADLMINVNWIHWQNPDLNFIRPILAGEGCWRNNCPMLLGERPTIYLTHLIPAITVVAAIWSLVNNGLNQHIIPPLVVIGVFTVPPAIAAATGRVFDHYVWPLIGNAFIIQASVISTLKVKKKTHSQHRPLFISKKTIQRLTKFLYIIFIALILIGQTRFNILYDPSEGLPSLNDNLSALRYAQKISSDAQAELIIQDYQPANELRCTGCRGWETLPALFGQELRVLPQDSGLPSPTTGAFLLRSASWPYEINNLIEPRTISKWFTLARIPTLHETQLDISGSHSFRFANGAVVLGLVTADRTPLEGSDPWPTQLVWQVEDIPSTDYKFFVHLVDSEDNKYAQADPLALPTAHWRLGETVFSDLNFSAVENIPDRGDLFIKFGMYDMHGNTPLIDQVGLPLDKHATIQIRGSATPSWVYSRLLVLDKFYTTPEQKQGQPLSVNLTWHAREGGLQNTQLVWQLLDINTHIVFDTITDIVPSTEADVLPASAFVSTQYELPIPTDFIPGPYTLTLQPTERKGKPIGDAFNAIIHITPRDRNFDLPAMQFPMSAVFNKHIRLVGYDLDYNNNPLNLTLHWMALTQIPFDYKYFVHVWSQNKIIAQADAMPDNYRYPTSWWAPTEVFSDTVTIDLGTSMPAEFQLTMGLYTPNGGRIPITEPDGTVLPDAALDLGHFSLQR